MTRINTNVSSLTAQNALANSQSQLQTALTRLSTGLRINSGADDPAGLIEAQNLGSEITADNSAISNSNQANDLISTADSALSQVSTLLNTIRGLVSDAANTGALTSSQISADQLQVDSSLQAIDQISQTTEFQGSRLLDGSLDFQTTSAGTVGTKASGTFGTSSAETAGTGVVGAAVATAASGTIGSGTTLISLSAATGTTTGNGLSVTIATANGVSGAVASATYSTSSNTIAVTIVTTSTTASDVAALITTAGAAVGVSASTSQSGVLVNDASYTAAVAGGAAVTAITLTSATGGVAANGLNVTYTTGSSTEAASASYNASSNTLNVSIQTATTTAADVATAINALSGSPVAATTTATAVVTTASFTNAVLGATASNEFTISATNAGSTYNGVTVAITSGASGSATASYSTASNTITVVATSTSTASDIATAISGISGSLFSSSAVGSGNGTVAAGTLSATTSGGSTADSISGLQINQANFGTSSSLPVNVTIEKQATQAELIYSGGALASATTLQIGGSNGYQVFDFGSGATVSQISSAINNASDSTGVTATVSGGNLVLTSQDYGSSNFVSADALTGTFNTVNTSAASVSRATGTDVEASINGVQATGAGLQVSLDTSNLNLSFNVSSLYSDNSTLSFDITGGGATFQLGPNVTSSQQVTLGIQGVSTATLGGADGTLYELASGGAADLSTDPSTAANIVDEVIDQVTSLQGRLGAFQSTTLQTNISSLTDAVSNLTSAQSDIQDADYATETAALTRAQVLVQAGTSVLSIANQEPQQVLSLLKAAGG